MAKKNNQSFSQMYLANALEGEVQAWVEQGWIGVTQTTLELFNYWFKRDEDAIERFHPCQGVSRHLWYLRVRACNNHKNGSI